jgi:2-polyprenyl-3-methyl-5-hydroxy-6-metoxy-1,4-benzoquinol methylase
MTQNGRFWHRVPGPAAGQGLTMIAAEPEAVAAARTSQCPGWVCLPGGASGSVVRGAGRLTRGMERHAWLVERRAALVTRWDAEAATYGDEEYPWDAQRDWVARVLRLIPPGATVLDAPCGTGKYFPMLAAAGVRVAGADQSAGMLARARARGIAFSLERTSLQDLSHVRQFDAVLTIDAMQHVPPEDWPGVLANLHRAARPDGLVYLTVQELHRHHLERAFESLSARGLPAMRGELVGGMRPVTPISRVATRQWAGSGSRAWRSSTRASGGETGGVTAISCCAPTRLRRPHDTAGTAGCAGDHQAGLAVFRLTPAFARRLAAAATL